MLRKISVFPMGICVLGAKMLKILTKGRVDLREKVLRMEECRAYSHESAEKDFGYLL